MRVVRHARFLLSKQAMGGRINKSEAASSSSYHYYYPILSLGVMLLPVRPRCPWPGCCSFRHRAQGRGKPDPKPLLLLLLLLYHVMSRLPCGPYLQYASTSHPSCLLACWSLSSPPFLCTSAPPGQASQPARPGPSHQLRGRGSRGRAPAAASSSQCGT